MSEQDFIHLHVHTEFSLLDGLSKISKLVKQAKALDMPALAITDHGTMFGVMDFYNACRAAEIKPIIGVESYLARQAL
jgi:DNA polymerase-3 subunit alpha